VVTTKTVTAQLRAARNVPLPAAPDVTFACNGKQVPPFPAPCSDTVLMTQLDAQGNATLLETIAHAASIFGS
jgi:branched-chain amino acid transport system substrate-binding protein